MTQGSPGQQLVVRAGDGGRPSKTHLLDVDLDTQSVLHCMLCALARRLFDRKLSLVVLKRKHHLIYSNSG